MSRISYVVHWTINDGELDNFKNMASGFVSDVLQSEPGTLGYQWWIGDDGRNCLLEETFESSEALLIHLGNVVPNLGDITAIAPITRIEVRGDASPEAREALAGLGATHFSHFAGFDR
jgi:quinol monooxygenase YgiN